MVSHVDAVPLQAKAQNPISIDSEESYSDPRIRVINIRKQLAAEMKPEVTILVEDMYNFKTSHWQLEAHVSASYNASRTQGLLRHMNFIHPVRVHPNTDC